MNERICFSCGCINENLYDCYRPEDDMCSWYIRAEVLAEYSWEMFIKDLKISLLTRSIHKGKFLGFKISETVVQNFDLSDVNLTSAGNILLIIDNMDICDDELCAVVELKKSTLDQLIESAVPEDINLFNMRLARELAYTSDKIEGTTIEAEEAKANLRHFRDELPVEQLDPDHIEMRNHMLAIVDIVFPMRDQPLTSINLAYMMNLHRALDVSHMREADKGAYRTVEVTIAKGPNPGFTRAADVPQAIEEMFTELHNMSDNTDTMHLAAWLHFKFVQIHPFVDGNGRVGRLLMNTLLLQRGYPLVCIHPNVRNIYYKSLQVARRIENGALSLQEGTKSPYDFLKRIISEFAVRSLDIGINTLSVRAP